MPNRALAVGLVLLIAVAWWVAAAPVAASATGDHPTESASALVGAAEQATHGAMSSAFDIQRKGLVKRVVTGRAEASSATRSDGSLWLADKPKPGQIYPDILRALVLSPWNISVVNIVHSPTFNPRSVPIPASEYEPLKAVLAHYVKHFDQILQRRGRVRWREVQALKDAGELFLYAPEEKLLMTNRITDYGRSRGQEFACFLIDYFAAKGYMTADERTKCLAEVAEAQDWLANRD